MFDPAIGRWISEDPLAFEAGDENLQRYVGNTPTNAIDPTGLEEMGTQKSADAPFEDPSWWYANYPGPVKPLAHIFVDADLEVSADCEAKVTVNFTLSSWVKESNSVVPEISRLIQRLKYGWDEGREEAKDTVYLDVEPDDATIHSPTFSGNLFEDLDDAAGSYDAPEIEAGQATRDNSPSISYKIEVPVEPSSTTDITVLFGQPPTKDKAMSNVHVSFSVTTDLGFGARQSHSIGRNDYCTCAGRGNRGPGGPASLMLGVGILRHFSVGHGW